jgi:recombination protein RecT
METAVATTQPKDLKSYFTNPHIQKRFHDVLGKKAQGFMVSVLSIAGQSDLLSKADPASVVNAAMTAATLDLPINQNLGFAYIIPYKGSAQFQMGYKGFIQLAQRSKRFETINVTDVREGEIKEFNRLTGEMNFDWKNDREKLTVVGYVAYMKLKDGFHKSLYMTVEELKVHGGKYSQTYKKGFGLWKDEFDAMASKTVLKLLLSKYAPLTAEMQTAQLADQAVIKGDDEYEYVDNKKELPDEIAKEKERERVVKYINNSETIEELEMCKDYIVDDETQKLFDEKKKELEEKNAK